MTNLVETRQSSRTAALFVATWAVSAVPACAAEYQIWLYGGYNTSFNSDVMLKPSPLSPTTTYRDVGWWGASFKMPPYWGVRGTYWLDALPGWGIGFDYSHAKAVAERTTALDDIASHLQFTNGLNIGTIDVMYRRRLWDRFTAYGGAGLGAAVPFFELNLRPPFDTNSFRQYELAGPVAQVKAGLEYEVAYNVSVFGEYKLAYSWLDVSFEHGGQLQTNIADNQFILGLSYTFR
jgi:lipid A oxidase